MCYDVSIEKVSERESIYFLHVQRSRRLVRAYHVMDREVHSGDVFLNRVENAVFRVKESSELQMQLIWVVPRR